MASKRKAQEPDWKAIEGHIRAGILSIREIARRDGNISEGAIRRRIKREGWKPDLEHAARQRAKDMLRRDQVRTEQRADPEQQEAIIEDAASEVADVVRLHRRDIQRGRHITNALFGQLAEVVSDRDGYEDLIDREMERRRSQAIAASSNGTLSSAEAQRLDAEERKLRRAISLPAHATVVRDLAQAMRHMVGLEREAYGLSKGDSGDQQDAPLVAYDVHFGLPA